MSKQRHDDLDRDVYRDPVNWGTALVAAVLAGLQFYEGIGPAWAGNTPAAPSLFVGGALLLGIAVFFTRLWRPALYVLGAVLALYVLVVWFIGGMAIEATSLATAASAVLLAVLCLVNFYREQVAYLSEEPPSAPGR